MGAVIDVGALLMHCEHAVYRYVICRAPKELHAEVLKLLVFGYCDSIMCEKDWHSRKHGTQAL